MLSQLYSGFLLGALCLLWTYRILLVSEQMSEAIGLVIAVCLLGIAIGSAFSRWLRKVPVAVGAGWALLTLPILSAVHSSHKTEPLLLTWDLVTLLPFGILLGNLVGGTPARWAILILSCLGGAGSSVLALPRAGAWTTQVIVALLFLLALTPKLRRKLAGVSCESENLLPPEKSTLFFAAAALAVLFTGWERLAEIAAGAALPALATPAALLCMALLGAALCSLLSPRLLAADSDSSGLGWCLLGLGSLGLVSWHGAVAGTPALLKFLILALVAGGLAGLLLSRLEAGKTGAAGFGTLLGTLTVTQFVIPHWGVEIALQLGSTLAFLGLWSAVARSLANPASLVEGGTASPPSSSPCNRKFFLGRSLLLTACILALPLVWMLPKAPTLAERHAAYHKDGVRVSLRLGYTAPDSILITANGSQQLWSEPGYLAGRKLLAYIPGFFQVKPKRAAVLGLSLPTIEILERSNSLQHIDWVAGDAAVARARDYVPGHANLDAPVSKTTIQTSSISTFVKKDDSKYDIIVSEASLPWTSGLGLLTSREFYRNVLSRLEETGVFCQVCDLNAFSPNDLRSVALTFCSTFPQSQIWQLSENTLALVGGPRELNWHPEEVQRRWRAEAEVRQDLVGLNILEPVHLVGFRLATSAAVLSQTRGARIVTEDAPLVSLQSSMPIALLEANTVWVKRLRGGGDYFRLGSAYAWLCVGDLEAVAGVLVGCPEGQPKAFLQCQLALLKKQDAQNQVQNALKTYPMDYRIRYTAALEAIQRRSYSEAAEHLNACVAQFSQAPPIDQPVAGAIGYAGSNGWEYPVYQALGACYEAQDQFQQACLAYQKGAEYCNLSSPLRALGRCLLHQRSWSLAQHSLIRAVQRDGNDYQAWIYLGQARIEVGQLEKAETALQEALSLVPFNHDARFNLAVTYAQQKNKEKAQAELRKLMLFYPGDAQALGLQSKL